MSDEFDDFARNLQGHIFEDTKDAYGTVAFERWLNPRYMGALNDPDGYARVTGPCNDTMEIFLRFRQERVTEASFQTDGCGSSAVCGSFAAEMAHGKTPDELLDVTWMLQAGLSSKNSGAFPKRKSTVPFLQEKPFRRPSVIT